MNEVLRQEKKFLVSLEQMYRCSHGLSQVMMQDPNNGPEGYCIRSLYFDTTEDTDFMDKVDGVEQIVIQRYVGKRQSVGSREVGR